MELMGYLCALGAATCWALASLLSVGPVRLLGPIPFNTLRMFMVALMLTAWLAVQGDLYWPSSHDAKILALSGFIGIFLGDTLLFTTVKILGPRLAGLLFATNAPITFLLGIWVLGEPFNLINLTGVFAVSGGVFLALASRGDAGRHQWETAVGSAGWGMVAGFGAALCQSLGALLIVGLLKDDQDPVFATMIRVWIAVAFLFLCLFWPKFSGGFARYQALNLRLVGHIAASGLVGMAIGMSLYLMSISWAPMGFATILSATTPIIVLPLLWMMTRERPATRSLWAAVVVVAGTAGIFLAPS